jgi:hypothetical protein
MLEEGRQEWIEEVDEVERKVQMREQALVQNIAKSAIQGSLTDHWL